ncbi:retrotransposon protein, putative, ty1-copia subclass [Tanacetum coccineum]
MTLPAQNISHSAFRLMLEREKLFDTNFNDRFCQLRIVLRVEKKLNTIELPIPPAHVAGATNHELEDWNKIYDVNNEVACLMLGSMSPKLQRQFENYAPYDMLQELKSMFEKQSGVESWNASVMTNDFAGFIRNYNMHNIGNEIDKLHALLIEYENILPKKGENKLSYTPKPKHPAPAAKEHPIKDATCHHNKEPSHWRKNCPVYLAELMKKKKQADSGISVSENDVLYFNVIPCDGIYEIDMLNLVTNVNSIYNIGNKRAKHNLDSTYLWHYRLAHISKKRIEKVFKNKVENQLGKTIKALRSDRGGEYINQEFKDYLKACGIVQQLTPPYTPQHNGYPKETMGYYICFPPENKIVVARYAKFFEKNLISQEASRRAVELEEIQEEDTSPSENTSEHLVKAENLEPREDVAPVRSYILDHESDKWLDAINEEMQSMKDNQVWRLIDLPPNAKTVGIKWLFKKKTDMDVNVHTYKANIRAIRILIAIVAYYDYEIWKMDVKSAFLNGYFNEDIYMVQLEGSIMYVVRCTRPDVAFARNITSHFQQNHGEDHWTAVKNILKRYADAIDALITEPTEALQDDDHDILITQRAEEGNENDDETDP